ncbi:MAG: ABC transporter ATP-binding protein [Chloroflexi bacterium]|nr:ABC transporter ATP-binding protein [Chloroflexota bacterium]
MPVIEVRDLQKAYGDLQAVAGVSFDVAEGEVFGMLGPNGAGKTTTVEILEGLRIRDAGQVSVLGLDPASSGSDFKRLVGVQLQQVALYPRLRVHEVISLFGSFYDRRASTDELIALMGLEDRRNARIAELSGGQAQRLSVALAVVNKPRLVFLDEPSTGMDPQARRNLWEIIEGFKADGMTVVLTTHYMEEAERLCDRVAVMDHGRIIALDSPGALVRASFDEDAIEFVSNDGLTANDLGGLAAVTSATSQGSAHSIFSSDIPRTMGSLLDLAAERGAPLEGMRVRHATLEDVFLKLTGRTLRD